MGFFNQLRKKVRGQIAPVMPMATQVPRPIGEMPLTPEQIARKAEYERNKAIENERNVISKYGSRENMERMVRDSFAGPRGNIVMGSDFFRMPQRPQRFKGLSGLFRRLQEQIRNQQMPQPMPELRAGDIMPNSPVIDTRSFPRIPGPPAVAPDIMPNLNPGMPRMAPPVMNQMQGPPRMMMAAGRDANMVDFLNSDPEQQIFGIETRIGILENQLQEALANNDRQAYDMIVDQINDADAQRIELMNLPGDLDRSRDQLIASASNRASDPDLFVEEFYGRMDPLLEKEGKSDENFRSNMRRKRVLDMMRNSSRFRGGKDNARSPSRRDLELMEMQRQQQQARESLDDILSDLEKKN